MFKVAEISDGINVFNFYLTYVLTNVKHFRDRLSLRDMRVSFMIHLYLSDRRQPHHPPPLQPPLSPDWPRGSSRLLPGDGAAELGLTGGWWLLSAAEEIKLELLLAAL